MSIFIRYIIVIILSSSCYVWAQSLESVSDKKILLMYALKNHETTSGMYGSSVYRINLYKLLLSAGVKVTMLVGHQSFIEECERSGLPYQACSKHLMNKRKTMTRKQECSYLVEDIVRICENEQITIIHCNVGDELEIEIAKKVKQKYPVKIVVTLHHEDLPRKNLMQGVDGVIGVTTRIKEHLESENRAAQWGVKHIMWVAPLFDQNRFLAYVPTCDRKTFFKQAFGIDLLDCPLLCMVGIFYKNSLWKNHEVLVQAVDMMIKKHKRKVQVVFAGDGPRKAYIEDLVHCLELEPYIHFLGYTKLIPDVLYHSDIKVLTSAQEGLPIALMEGALMRKPLIGTRGTGMENIIQHEATGLLFQSGDIEDLVFQIERLIDSPEIAHMLGDNAYRFMMEYYESQHCLEEIMAFYSRVLSE